ncbi:MAG: DNA-processing protein DprA [Saprospiraceae bacterium]|nr:DNA-processing protein DprA [Saprospiraceae bacterium]
MSTKNQNELFHLIALSMTPRIGAKLIRTLVQQFGSAYQVFEASLKELSATAGVSPSMAREILKKGAFHQAEQELIFISEYDIQPISFTDEEYPQRLLHCPDCPALLYYKGNTELNAQRVVSIVGTRKPNRHSLQFCENLVDQLQALDVLLVSGLAYGIDACAHQQCVQNGISTIGVVAHGLDRIYPAKHKALAKEMLNCGGLLTEFYSKTAPLQQNFPMRNRIIAGMSDAVIVVETKRKGGSIITAHLANDYNRDVFAVPTVAGIDSGCNWLIKTHKASMLESVEDLAYIMRWQQGGRIIPKPMPEMFSDLNTEEKRLVECLKLEQSLNLDELIRLSSLTIHQLSILLLGLELKGIVEVLPANRYQLLK